MVDRAGQLQPGGLSAVTVGRPDWYGADLPVGNRGVNGSLPLSGVRFNRQPTSELQRDHYGQKQIGFVDDFYNRIHVTPSVLSLGNVVQSQNHQIEVWSSYFVDKHLTGLIEQGNDGISLFKPVTEPYTLKPLESLIYVAGVSTDGPPAVNASYTWVIDGGEHRSVITGQRIVAFPFLPDWSVSPKETLRWLTDVIRSEDGSEQRMQLREHPRHELDYRVTLLDGVSVSRLETLLFGWGARDFAVPIATDKTYLISDVYSGNLSLGVATDTFGFYAGGLAMIYQDQDNFEMVEVKAVGVSALELLRPLEASWPKDTLVMPANPALIGKSTVVNRITNTVGRSSIGWTFTPVDSRPELPTANAPLVYDGYEFFIKKANWRSPHSYQYQQDYEVFDSSTSGVFVDAGANRSDVIRKVEWLLKGRQEVKRFKQFLARRQGRNVPVWLPSRNEDFRLTDAVSASSTSIKVHDNYYLNFVGTHSARRDIFIQLDDGSYIARKIVSVSRLSGGSVGLGLNAALGVDIDLNNITYCCLLTLYRLASDDVTIEWLTTEVAQTTVNLIAVTG